MPLSREHAATATPSGARRASDTATLAGRGTAVRLVGAFVAVLALFGAALLVTLATLGRIARSEDQVAFLDHAKHAGHLAANQVREQLIQQVRMIVSGDVSHRSAYRHVVEATVSATQHLTQMMRAGEERALAEQIARVARATDEDFRMQVLPLIEQGDDRQARLLHERITADARRVVALNEELNGILERRSNEARARTDELRNQVRVTTLVCFGLAIAIAAALGFWLIRSILRPVEALRAGALRIGAGDLTARIRVQGKDELAALANTFNQMAENLDRHQRELVRSQRLASIGQVAAGVAHEINNPIGVILGYVKLMRRDAALAASEDLKIIEDEAYQCHRIVQGLLDLARPPRLELSSVDAASLAREAMERLRESGKLQGVRVVEPTAPVPVRADETRLRQVLLNILLNAAEAAGLGGTVTVRGESSPELGTLTISDDGPGIPPDVIGRVFDPFFTTKKNGTGLGLAVAQTIVEAHGGAIEIDSGERKGTLVRLRLPAAPSQEGAR